MRLPKTIVLFLAFVIMRTDSGAQTALPLIRANSKTVSVRDGTIYKQGIWVISPDVRPDVYVVEKGKSRKVSFYTDIDSISFDVIPGKNYDFIILLNNRDSAYTRVTTVNPEKVSIAATRYPDTIPFHFGRAGKIFLEAAINGSKKLNMMFDTGADNVVLSGSGQKKLGKLTIDGSSDNVGFGGTTTIGRSTKNSLDLGKLHCTNVPVLLIDNADGDGIIGYNVFEDHIVQIDFDKKIMVIYETLPEIPSGFRRSPIRFRNNLAFVEAGLFNGSSLIKGWVEYDSGSSGSLFVNEEFVRTHGLRGKLEKTAERKSRGMGPNAIYSDLVKMPAFELAGYSLSKVPVDLEQASANKALEWPIMGMDIIKRFNVYIDYKHFDMYFQPNTLVKEPYNEPTPMKWIIIGAILLVSLVLAGYFIYRRMGMRSR